MIEDLKTAKSLLEQNQDKYLAFIFDNSRIDRVIIHQSRDDIILTDEPPRPQSNQADSHNYQVVRTSEQGVYSNK